MFFKAKIMASVMTFLSTLWVGPHEVTFVDCACIKAHHKYRYLLCHDVKVEVDKKPLIIPANFDTDLASIPKPLWPFMSPAYSAFIAPSILHDYLYRHHDERSRREIDAIFYSALVNEGLGKWTATKMWLAVRLFGKKAYDRNS